MRRAWILLLAAACSHTSAPSFRSRSLPTSDVIRTTSPLAATGGLQSAVDNAASGHRVPVQLAVIDLRTGQRAGHGGDRVVLSASLYKLFVARELFARIAAGDIGRGDASGDGAHTVAECLRLMIVVSSDECGVAGINMVGRGALDPKLHADGFTGTYLASPQRTTAADVAELLRREHDANTELYGLLKQQQVNDRIPPALPPGTPIAHKTGDRTGWAHDAGVITTPTGDLVVSVLTGPWPSPCCHEERVGALEREAFAVIGSVARQIYDATA